MRLETIPLTTTMDVNKLLEIEKPNSQANNFSYEFKMLLSQSGVESNIKEFTNKAHSSLHIQLVCREKYQSDKVDIAMIKLKKYYNFNWGYVSDINGKLIQNVPARNIVINIDIFSIRMIEKLVA